MVADEIIARADGPNGLKAQTAKAIANVSGKKAISEENVPFFASASA